MRNLIFFLLIFASCQSEPIELSGIFKPDDIYGIDDKTPVWDGITEPTIEWSERSGNLQPLWYRESMTTDNYVLVPNQQRTQRAYNKAIIDSVFMLRLGTEIVNVNYVDCGFYNVKVKFNGDTIIQQGTFLSTIGPNIINYKPFGSPVLHSTNRSRITSLLMTADKIQFPGWEMGRMKWKFKYVVMLDADTLGVDYITPNHPVGAGYTMAHK